ncbi:DUF5776 domain-containing protein [Apilactobacillus kunkeei]|uniref:DUF5776 domain-containing protein n=1 Tax=Apilactobacillus kunkeei TaxID=148814 RepID=A0A0N0CU97_9LACO|nr:DUF5776 domain-containing protein [Apilactobacillus kunkeei]KOY79688.1 hypothetical protein RZ72_07460 [Apilactobacillus kunkeei]
MQYNKNEIQKTNDKKILRKVKKQWVVVSLSSFALLGATSLALMSQGVKASADTTSTNQSTHVQSDISGSNNQSNGVNSDQGNTQNNNQSANSNTDNSSLSNNNDDDSLSNRMGDDKSSQSGDTSNVTNALSNSDAQNFKNYQYGNQKNATTNNAKYSDSISQGVNDAYAGHISAPNSSYDNSNKDLYEAAYEGVNADASKGVSENMTNSSISDIKTSAQTSNSLLYIAYQYGVDFKRTADLAYKDAVSSNSNDYSKGTNRPTEESGLQSIYDNAYAGVRQALNAQFNSDNSFNTTGYASIPDMKNVVDNNTEASSQQYQAAYNKTVNDFNNGIVYVNNSSQYMNALNNASNIKKIILTNNINASGSVNKITNILVDGQGNFSLAGSVSFAQSDRGNTITIQNMKSINNPYYVGGDGFVGYNNVRYNGTFADLFNPKVTQSNGNFILGANVTTSDSTTNSDGSIKYNVDFDDTVANPVNGKLSGNFVVGENGKYTFNSLYANNLVFKNGAVVSVNPTQIDNHIYSKSFGKMVQQKELDGGIIPRYGLLTTGNINVNLGATVNVKLSDNTNAIRVGDKKQETAYTTQYDGNHGNLTISGTVNISANDGIVPTALDKNLVSGSLKGSSPVNNAVVWLGMGMQVLPSGTFNMDLSNINNVSDTGTYNALIYGPYKELAKGSGTRGQSISKIVILQNGAMNAKVNTGNASHNRIAYLPIVAFNPRQLSLNLSVPSGKNGTGAAGVKISLSPIDVFGGKIDQDTIDNIYAVSGYQLNPYIYHYRLNGGSQGITKPKYRYSESFQDINGVTNGYKKPDTKNGDKAISFSLPYSWRDSGGSGDFGNALSLLGGMLQLYEDIQAYNQPYDQQIENANIVTNSPDRAHRFDPKPAKVDDPYKVPTQDQVDKTLASMWQADKNDSKLSWYLGDTSPRNNRALKFLNGQTFQSVAGMNWKAFTYGKITDINMSNTILKVAKVLSETVNSLARDTSNLKTLSDNLQGDWIAGMNQKNGTSIEFTGSPSIQFDDNLSTYVDGNGDYHVRFAGKFNNPNDPNALKKIFVHYATGSFNVGENNNQNAYINMINKGSENDGGFIDLSNSPIQTDANGNQYIEFNGDINLHVKTVDTVGVRLNAQEATGLTSSQGPAYQPIASVSSTYRPGNNSYQTNVDGYNSVVSDMDNGKTLSLVTNDKNDDKNGLTDNDMHSIPASPDSSAFISNINEVLSNLGNDSNNSQYYINKTSSNALPQPTYKEFSVNNQNVTPYDDSGIDGTNNNGIPNDQVSIIRVFAIGDGKKRLLVSTTVARDSITKDGNLDINNYPSSNTALGVLKDGVSKKNNLYQLDLSQTPLNQYSNNIYDVYVPDNKELKDGAQIPIGTASGSVIYFKGTANVDSKTNKIISVTPNLKGFKAVANSNGIYPDKFGNYTLVPEAGEDTIYIDDASGNPTGISFKAVVLGNGDGTVSATKSYTIPSGKNDGTQYVVDKNTYIGVVTDKNTGVQTYHVKLTAQPTQKFVDIQTPSGSPINGGGIRSVDDNGNIVTTANMPGFDTTPNQMVNSKYIVNPAVSPTTVQVPLYNPDTGKQVVQNNKPVTVSVQVQGQSDGTVKVVGINDKTEFKDDVIKTNYKVNVGDVVNANVDSNGSFIGPYINGTSDGITKQVVANTQNGNNPVDGGATINITNGKTTITSNMPGFDGVTSNGNKAVLKPSNSPVQVAIPVISSTDGSHVGDVTVKVQGKDDGHSYITSISGDNTFTDDKGNTYTVNTNTQLTAKTDRNGQIVPSAVVTPTVPETQTKPAVTPTGQTISAGATITQENGSTISKSNIPGFDGSTPAKFDNNGNAVLKPSAQPESTTIAIHDATTGFEIGTMTVHVQGKNDGNSYVTSVDDPSNGTIKSADGNNSYTVSAGTQITVDQNNPTKFIANVTPTFSGNQKVNAVTDSGSSIQGGATITSDGNGGKQAQAVLPGFAVSTDPQTDANGSVILTPASSQVQAQIDVYDQSTNQKVGTTTVSVQGNEDGTSSIIGGTVVNGNNGKSYVIPSGTNIGLSSDNKPMVGATATKSQYNPGDNVPITKTITPIGGQPQVITLPFQGTVQADGSIDTGLAGFDNDNANGSSDTTSSGKAPFNIGFTTNSQAAVFHVYNAITGRDTGKTINLTVSGDLYDDSKLVSINGVDDSQPSGVVVSSQTYSTPVDITDDNNVNYHTDNILTEKVFVHAGANASGNYYYLSLIPNTISNPASLITSTGSSVGVGTISIDQNNPTNGRAIVTPDNPGFASGYATPDSTNTKLIVQPTTSTTSISIKDANGNTIANNVNVTVQGQTNGQTTLTKVPNNGVVQGSDGNTYQITINQPIVANQPNTMGNGYYATGKLVGINSATVTNTGQPTQSSVNNVSVQTDANGNQVVSQNTVSSDGEYIIPSGTPVTGSGNNHSVAGLPYSANDQSVTIPTLHFDNKNKDTGITSPNVKGTVQDDGTITLNNDTQVPGPNNTTYVAKAGSVIKSVNNNGVVEYHVESKRVETTKDVPATLGNNTTPVNGGATVKIDPSTGQKTIISNVPGFGFDNGQKSETVDANITTDTGVQLVPVNDSLKGVHNDNNGTDTGSTTNNLPIQGQQDGTIKTTANTTSTDGKYIIPAGTTVTKDANGQYHANSLQLNSDGTVTLNNTSYNGTDGSSTTGQIKAIVGSDGTIKVNSDTALTDQNGKVYTAHAGSLITPVVNNDGTISYQVNADVDQQDKVVPAKTGSNGSVVQGGATIHTNPDGTKTITSNVPGFIGQYNVAPSQVASVPTLAPGQTTISSVSADDDKGNSTGKTISQLTVQGHDDGSITVASNKRTTDGNNIAIVGSTVVKSPSDGNYHVQTLPIDNDDNVTISQAQINDDKNNKIDHKDITAHLNSDGSLTLNQSVHTVTDNSAYDAAKGTTVVKSPDGNGYVVNSVDNTARITNATLIDVKDNTTVGHASVNVDKTTGLIIGKVDLSPYAKQGADNAGYHVQNSQTVSWNDGSGNVNNSANVNVIQNSPFTHYYSKNESDKAGVEFINSYSNEVIDITNDSTNYDLKVTDSDNKPYNYGTKDADTAISGIPSGYMFDHSKNIEFNSNSNKYDVPVVPINASIPTALIDGKDGQVKSVTTLPVKTNNDGSIVTNQDHVSKGKNDDPNYYFVPSGSTVTKQADGSFHADGYEIPANPDGTFDITSGQYDDKDKETSYPGKITANIDSNTGKITIAKASVTQSPDGTIYQVDAGEEVTPKFENGDVQYHVTAHVVPATQNIPAKTGTNGQVVNDGATVTINPTNGTKTITSNVPGFAGQNNVPVDQDTSNTVLTPVNDVAKDVHFDANGQPTQSIGDVPVKGDNNGNIIVTKNTKSSDGQYMVPAGSTIAKGSNGNYHAPSFPLNADGSITINNGSYDASDKTSQTGGLNATVDNNGNMTVSKASVVTDSNGNVYVAHNGAPITPVKDANGSVSYHVNAEKVVQNQSIAAQPGQASSMIDDAAYVHVNDDGSKTVMSNMPGFTGFNVPEGQSLPSPVVLTPIKQTLDNVHLDNADGSDTGKTANSVPVVGQADGTIKTTNSVITPDGRIILANTTLTKDKDGNWHADSYPYDAGNRQVTLPNVPIKDENGNVVDHQDVVANVDLNSGALTVADSNGVHAVTTIDAYQADQGTQINRDANGVSVPAINNTAVISNATLVDEVDNSNVGTGVIRIDKTTGKVIVAQLPTTGGNKNSGFKVFDKDNQIVNWKDQNGNVNPNAVVEVIDNAPYHANNNVKFLNIYNKQVFTNNTKNPFVYVSDSDSLPIHAGTPDAYMAVNGIPDGYKYASGRQIIVDQVDNNNPDDNDKRVYTVPVIPDQGTITNASVFDQSGNTRVDKSQSLPVNTNSDGSITTNKDVIAMGNDKNYYMIPSGTTINTPDTPDAPYTTTGTKLPTDDQGIVTINNANFEDKNNSGNSTTGTVTATVDTNNGILKVAKTTVINDPNDSTKAYLAKPGEVITVTTSNGQPVYHVPSTVIEQNKDVSAQLGKNGPISDGTAKVVVNNDGSHTIVSKVPGFTGTTIPEGQSVPTNPVLKPSAGVINGAHVLDNNNNDTQNIANNIPVFGQDDGSIRVTAPVITPGGRIILPRTEVTKDANGNWNVPSYQYDANTRQVILPNVPVKDASGKVIGAKDVHANINPNTGEMTLADDNDIHVVRDTKSYQADKGTPIANNNGTISLTAQDDTVTINNPTLIDVSDGHIVNDVHGTVVVDKTTGLILSSNLPDTGGYQNGGYHIHEQVNQVVNWKGTNGQPNDQAIVNVRDNNSYTANNNVKFLNIYDNKVFTNSGSSVYVTDSDHTPIYAGTENAYKAVNNIPAGYNYAIGKQITKVTDGGQTFYQVPVYLTNGIIKNATIFDNNNNVKVDHGKDLPVNTDTNGDITTTADVIAKGKDGNYYVVPSGSSVNQNPNNDGTYATTGSKLPSSTNGVVNISNAHFDDEQHKKSVIGPITANVDSQNGKLTVAHTSVKTDPDDPTKAYRVDQGAEVSIVNNNGNVEYHVHATQITQDGAIPAKPGQNSTPVDNAATVHYNDDGSKTINSSIPGYKGYTVPDGQDVPANPTLTPVDDVAKNVHFDHNGQDTNSIGDVPVRGDDNGNIAVTQNTTSSDGKFMIPKGTIIAKNNDGSYHGTSLPVNSDGTVLVQNVNVQDNQGKNKAKHDFVANVDNNGQLTTAKDQVVQGNDNKQYIIPAGTPIVQDPSTHEYKVVGNGLPFDNGVVTIDNGHYDNRDNPSQSVPAKIVATVDNQNGKLTMKDTTVVTDPNDPHTVYKANAGDPIIIKSDGNNGVEYHVNAIKLAQDYPVDAQTGINGPVVPASATVHYNSDGSMNINSNVPGFKGYVVPNGQSVPDNPVLTPVDDTASDVHFDNAGNDTGSFNDLPVKGDDNGNIVVTHSTKSTDSKRMVPAGTVIKKGDDGKYHAESLPIDKDGNVVIDNANVNDANGIPRAQTKLVAKVDDQGNIVTVKDQIVMGNDNNYYMVPAESDVTKNPSNGSYQVSGKLLPTNPDGTVTISDAHFDDKTDPTKSVKGDLVAVVDPENGTLSVKDTTVVNDPTNPKRAYRADANEPITVVSDGKGGVQYHVSATPIDQDAPIAAKVGANGLVDIHNAHVHVNGDGSKTVVSDVPGFTGQTFANHEDVPETPDLTPTDGIIDGAHFDSDDKDTNSIGRLSVRGDDNGNIVVTHPTKSSDGKFLVLAGTTAIRDNNGNYHANSYPVNPDGTITIDNVNLDGQDKSSIKGTAVAKVNDDGSLIVVKTTVTNDGNGHLYTANENTPIRIVINSDGTTSLHVDSVKSYDGLTPEEAAKKKADAFLPVPSFKGKDKEYISRFMTAYKEELRRVIPTYVYSTRGLYVHSSEHLTVFNRVKGYAKKPRNLAHVFKVRGFKLAQNKYPRLKVDGGYISLNKYIRDAYYRTNHPLFRVIRKTGVLIHTSKKFHYGKKHVIRLRRGALIHVKKVVKYHNITRLYIGNGKYVTSNKTYVALAKKSAPLYVYWTNKRGVYVNTRFTRKNAVKYFSKRPRNKANAYKVLRIVKTKNGIKYRIKPGYINAKGTIPAYYVRRTKLIRVIRNRGILVHYAKKFTRRNAIKHFRKNTLIRVRSVARFYGITRFYIGNGEYITSNKTWVNRIK